MKRPINSIDGSQRPEGKQGLRLWHKVLMGFGVLFIVMVVGVGLVGLKFMRKYSKLAERNKTLMLDDESVRTSRRPATMEDSLEKIDLRKATVTGLRGYDRLIVPYTSQRDTIARLLGREDSAMPSPISCNHKTLLYYYRGNVIDIDTNGSTMVRTIDLFANPEVKISAGQFILSRSTTLAGFARRFPFSADHKLPQGYYGLRPLRGKPGELLHLTFDKQGRLAYVHYYTGC